MTLEFYAPDSLKVDVLRADFIESTHVVDAVIVDHSGNLIEAYGQSDSPYFPRSAIKALQAIPYITSGAFEAQGSNLAHLALACASHSGEPTHTKLVTQWLHNLGLREKHLACGPHSPLHEATAQQMVCEHMACGRHHNNCSGKHTAMLATCVHLNEPLESYHDFFHPAQRRILQTLTDWCGLDDKSVTYGIDGCGVPTFRMTLRQMARGLAKIASSTGTPTEKAATQYIKNSMNAHPELVSGTGRFCLSLANRTHRQVIPKVGAEGLYTAMIPQMGWGLALKVRDGSKRAAEAAVEHLLVHHGFLHEQDIVLRNTRDEAVGSIRVGVSTTQAQAESSDT